MGHATKAEALDRAVAILGNMVGKDLKLKVLSLDTTRKYRIDGPEFDMGYCTFEEIFEHVLFAITALRMAQNTTNEVTTVIVKDGDLNIVETYTFRGHMPLADATKIAIDAEVFQMTTDDDYTEEEARAFLKETAEFEALHLTIR